MLDASVREWDDLADEGWGEACDPDDSSVVRWAETDPDTALWYGDVGHMREARHWEPLGGWQPGLFDDQDDGPRWWT